MRNPVVQDGQRSFMFWSSADYGSRVLQLILPSTAYILLPNAENQRSSSRSTFRMWWTRLSEPLRKDVPIILLYHLSNAQNISQQAKMRFLDVSRTARYRLR